MDDRSFRRERKERLLRPVCSALGIEEELSSLGLCSAREYSELFPDTSIFVVTGCGFERPSLPSGSYMYCVHSQNQEPAFAELTPRNSALNELLCRHWDLLPKLAPVRLVDFVLTMQTVGTVYHEVLDSMSDLGNRDRREEGFVLNDQAIRLKNEMAMSTSLDASDNTLSICALTLFGWMHDKQNLGITRVHISQSGRVVIGERETICEPVFRKTPDIWY